MPIFTPTLEYIVKILNCLSRDPRTDTLKNVNGKYLKIKNITLQATSKDVDFKLLKL